HPEYSTPEVTHPLAAVLHERAGELIMLSALRRTNAVPGTPQVNLYKNNTDNKGASYGAHENYLVDRSVPFAS
ncbi:MAG TPA: proteasome accessory factor PafA2, partial [Actinobacteria bacterium]|nr:proteasome accessory factor PafA2 [Actinomycetota bacterium]